MATCEFANSLNQVYEVEITYVNMKERHEEWRWDVMFFLIMNTVVDIFIIVQFLYLGLCKKTDVVLDSEQEEITFIIKDLKTRRISALSDNDIQNNSTTDRLAISEYSKLKKRHTFK